MSCYDSEAVAQAQSMSTVWQEKPFRVCHIIRVVIIQMLEYLMHAMVMPSMPAKRNEFSQSISFNKLSQFASSNLTSVSK
jgi:hypothetical protein